MERSYIFVGEFGFSIAMDAMAGDSENEQSINLAVAFCNQKDDFNKRMARKILDGRLNNGSSKFIRTQQCVSSKPRQEIMMPMANLMRDFCKEEMIVYKTNGEIIKGKFVEFLTNDNGNTKSYVLNSNGSTFIVHMEDVKSVTITGVQRNVDNMLKSFKNDKIENRQEMITI